MNTGSFIKAAFPALIEATNDSLAPVKLQSAHGAVNSVSRMLAKMPGASEEQANEIMNKLASNWTEQEIEVISSEPNFIIALAGMLTVALENFVIKTTGPKL